MNCNLIKEKLTKGIAKKTVIKVFRRTSRCDVVGTYFGYENKDMRTPL